MLQRGAAVRAPQGERARGDGRRWGAMRAHGDGPWARSGVGGDDSAGLLEGKVMAAAFKQTRPTWSTAGAAHCSNPSCSLRSGLHGPHFFKIKSVRCCRSYRLILSTAGGWPVLWARTLLMAQISELLVRPTSRAALQYALAVCACGAATCGTQCELHSHFRCVRI